MGKQLIGITCKLTPESKRAIEQNKLKVLEFIEKQQFAIMCDYARYSVIEAVTYYSEHYPSLTGNTLSGFGAAVYKDGILYHKKGAGQSVFMADELLGVHPTNSFVEPGNKNGTFMDYDSGETVEYVKDYNPPLVFVNADRDETVGLMGFMTTNAFLHSPEAASHAEKKGFSVIVANVSPYIEYLEVARGFEILDTVWMKSAKIFKAAVNRNVPSNILSK